METRKEKALHAVGNLMLDFSTVGGAMTAILAVGGLMFVYMDTFCAALNAIKDVPGAAAPDFGMFLLATLELSAVLFLVTVIICFGYEERCRREGLLDDRAESPESLEKGE